MTQPPQDGFGPPQYPGQQPQQPPPPQQPPAPPQQQPGYGYPSAQQQPQAQQPPQQPTSDHQYGQPYGQTSPYGQQQYGYGYPPPPPPGPSGSNGKLVAIIGAAVLAVLLIAGGVYFVVSGDDDGGNVAKPKSSESATSEPSDAPTDEYTEEPTDEPTDDYGDETPGPHSKEDGFKGQWQSDDSKTLTIGEELESGKGKGKNSVTYLGTSDGLCFGLGQEQIGGKVFRIALKCGTGEDAKYIAGTSKQDGDSLTITWDKGGSDTLDWNGDT